MTRKHRHRDKHLRHRGTFDEEFFLRHLENVRNKLTRMGFRAADLDDLVQQTFVVAHRRWDERPKNHGRRRNWLEAIAWRLGMNLRRKRIRRREILDPERLDTFPGYSADPDSILDLRRIFHPKNDALLPEDRALLFAYYVDDVPLTELAARLGLPRSTTWTRIQRIRRDIVDGTPFPEHSEWHPYPFCAHGVNRIE